MKLTQLVLACILVASILAPMAKAEIEISQINIADVVVSTPPNYGAARFTIRAVKPEGLAESTTVPVMVNGTTISSIGIIMSASEVSKSISANTTFPGAKILMVNPFMAPNPIPSSIIYPKSLNPYMNPISSIQYEIKIGEATDKITLMVYADWSIWAIIINIVAVAATAILVRRMTKT